MRRRQCRDQCAACRRSPQFDDENFRRLVEVNIVGAFNILREAARQVADGGTIIAVSTSLVRVAAPGLGPYSATKAAVESMVRSMSKELAGRGVRVNAVAPGPVDTDLFRAGKNEEALKRSAAMSPFNRVGQPAGSRRGRALPGIGQGLVGARSDRAAQWRTGLTLPNQQRARLPRSLMSGDLSPNETACPIRPRARPARTSLQPHSCHHADSSAPAPVLDPAVKVKCRLIGGQVTKE